MNRALPILILVGVGLPALGVGLAQGGVGQAAPTFTRDVQPIVQAQCVSCHRAGGIAPFALETYPQARAMAKAMAAATTARVMPPWMPGGKTPPLKYERKLTDAQIQTIAAWAAAGAPQ